MGKQQIRLKEGKKHLFLFDLGGVIINLDWEKSFIKVSEILDLKRETLIQMIQEHPAFLRLELGHVSQDQFFIELSEALNKEFDFGELYSAFNLMLLDIPPERVELISELRSQGHRVACLSNTNVMHMERFDQILASSSNFLGIHDLVDDAFLSHELGLKKPDPNAFLEVMKRTQTKPADVLFFDDLEENVSAARELGIDSRLIQDYSINELIQI